MKYNERITHWRIVTRSTIDYGYTSLRQLIYFAGPHSFIPGLGGFFYCPAMDLPPLLVVAE